MKIVLAYSGGLDTSVIVKWLRETYDAEIVTFAADIGQEEELKGLPQKARRTGASKHYTLDLVEEFARDWVNLYLGGRCRSSRTRFRRRGSLGFVCHNWVIIGTPHLT